MRGRPLTYTASADVVVDADGRELHLARGLVGHDQEQRAAISRTSDMNVRTDADTRCTDMSGVTTGKVEGLAASTQSSTGSPCARGHAQTSSTIQSIAKNGKRSIVVPASTARPPRTSRAARPRVAKTPARVRRRHVMSRGGER